MGWNSCNPGRTSSGRTISAGCSTIGRRDGAPNRFRSGAVGCRRHRSFRSTISPAPKSSASDGSARFRSKFHGSRLAEALGPIDGVGKFLDDFLPPSYLRRRIATYRQGAEQQGARSTPFPTCATPPAASSTTSGCCCRSAMAAARSTTSSPRSRRPARRALREAQPDEVPEPAAGICTLHDDPILKCFFPFSRLHRLIFRSPSTGCQLSTASRRDPGHAAAAGPCHPDVRTARLRTMASIRNVLPGWPVRAGRHRCGRARAADRAKSCRFRRW